MGRKRVHSTLPGESDRDRTLRIMREAHLRHKQDPEFVERKRSAARAWYAANTARGRSNAKAWKTANPERKRQLDRAWAERNPELARQIAVESQHRRRAQKAGGHVSRAEWTSIKEYFGHRCAYCLKPSDRLEMEHVVALSVGGEHLAHNVVPACRPCNARKNNKGVLSMLNTQPGERSL